MKDTETKSTKKKKLLFWLTLSASLLTAAAIAVGIVFAVRGNRNNLTIDNTPSDKEENKGDGENPPKEDDIVDTSTMYEFISPIESVNLIKAHEFCYDRTMDWYRLHQAMDFSAEAGTNVLSAVDGTITSIIERDTLDYAVVKISHAGDISTVYKFIDPAAGLKVGQTVKRGQVIGTVAPANGSENADGAHLHFEVFKSGELADPDDYLNINSK